MPRPGISYEQVATEAARLVAAGSTPSIDAIRAGLGTGSPNTIIKHLKAWRESVAPSGPRTELNASVVKAILDDQARGITEARAEADRQIATLQSDVAQLTRHIERQDGDLADVRRELASTVNEREQVRGRLDAAAQSDARQQQTIDELRQALEAANVSRMQAESREAILAAQLEEARRARQPVAAALEPPPASGQAVPKRKKASAQPAVADLLAPLS